MFHTKQERYQFAEQLYCYTDRTMQEISEMSSIPIRTLYERAKKYKWESLRRATRRSPAILAEEMYRELADLTAVINRRPEGERIPTPTEAELRRKIVYSIAVVKKFPTHAEAAWVLQSLLRYNDTFHDNKVDGLGYLAESFLAHRDVYGFASFQPEHNQDLNQPADHELETAYERGGEPRTTVFEDPSEDVRTQEGYLRYMEDKQRVKEEQAEAERIVRRFK